MRKHASYTKPRFGLPYITGDLVKEFNEDTWFTGESRDVINFSNPKALLAATLLHFFSDDVKNEVRDGGELQPQELGNEYTQEVVKKDMGDMIRAYLKLVDEVAKLQAMEKSGKGNEPAPVPVAGGAAAPAQAAESSGSWWSSVVGSDGSADAKAADAGKALEARRRNARAVIAKS